MSEYPAPATIVITDIEDYSGRSDLRQRRAREDMYAWLSRAFGPLWSRCFHEDRGDGVLMLWPADVPRAVVVAAVLRLAAAAPGGADRPRMRVATHAGDVFRDARGFVGGDLNEAFRLSTAALLKAALREAGGPVAHLVSDHVHHGIVRYGDPGIDLRSFYPVGVTTKERRMRAWLHIPGEDGLAARLAAQADAGHEPSYPPGAGPEPWSGGVQLHAQGDMTITGTDIAGRDLR